jgi:electron transport complex protein RnfC
VHPPELKQLTATQNIRRMPFPSEVLLPLRQHAGKPAKLLVTRGDHVERGDLLAAADGFMSVPVHASASGRVAEICFWPHPDGSMCEAVRIVVDKYSTQLPRPRVVPKWEGLTREQVVAAVQQAGIVGLGGAAFPAHVKLVPPKDTRIELLLLNGAECEPYLTTDHRLMAEQPERVLYGARIMMHALGVSRCVIGVERNKPDAIAALTAALPTDIDIKLQPLTVKYPQGAEDAHQGGGGRKSCPASCRRMWA